MTKTNKAAVFFVGNKLEMDDGIGSAAYEAFCEKYAVGENVELFDVGCLSLDMLDYVKRCDFILTVDAVDGTDAPAGTVFEYNPDDMARNFGPSTSLHDMKLADLFDRAALLGYECEGWCLGMQVQNANPADFHIGLSDACERALPLLVDAVAAKLVKRGYNVRRV